MIHPTAELQDYQSLLRLSYEDAVNQLRQKYGPVKDNFFSEVSYERFLVGTTKTPAKRKYGRTEDGLYTHHVLEDQYLNLGNPRMIKEKQYPFETQLAQNLVYANLIEHIILHVLIAQKTDANFGMPGVCIFLLPQFHKWYITGEQPNMEWMRNCYQAAELPSEDAKRLWRELIKILQLDNATLQWLIPEYVEV